jgi:fluoride exporter
MTLGIFLLTAVAGGVGAGARYLLDLAVSALVGTAMPWGTLLVNVTGSFALGLAVGLIPESAALVALGTGLLGGYTTFGSVSAAGALMLRERRRPAALANILGTLALTVAAAGAGLALSGVLR